MGSHRDQLRYALRTLRSPMFTIVTVVTIAMTYAAVPLGVLAAAAVSSYLPARRVSALDPAEALRAE